MRVCAARALHPHSWLNDCLLCAFLPCLVPPPMQIYGGTAQDFGPTRPNWESYGWSLFKLSNPPDSTYNTDVKVQVCTPVC
jgi:hypothetical protein